MMQGMRFREVEVCRVAEVEICAELLENPQGCAKLNMRRQARRTLLALRIVVVYSMVSRG